MRRPGLWVTNGIPSDVTKMYSWRPGSVTCFFDYLAANRVWDYKAQNPDASIIIRFQHPRHWHEDPAGWARWLGDQVVSKWPELRSLDPYVYFGNEMNLHYENGDPNPGNQWKYTTPEFYEKYANWVRMTADHIKQRLPEMKLICPPFASGHHEDGAPDWDGNPTEEWAGFDYLADTVRDYFDGIIAHHDYWGDSGGSHRDWLYDPELSSWYAFRWRRVLKLFENRYGIQARVIIDEAGNFGASDPDFTDQIIYHATECLSDSRLIAVTYFLWEDPTNSPGNILNSWVQRCLDLDDHVDRLAAMPSVEIMPPGPTIRLLLKDGTVQVIPMEEYLRAVVPAEMYATWPTEALKAQAVAARSYAMFAKEHPRHPNADLCTEASHCQAYDPRRIHPASDEAVRLTAGEVIEYEGEVANALFSANCGSHTLNNEDAFGLALAGLTPVPYLRGVPCINPGPVNGHRVGMCQWGAHDMAQRGDDYVTILKHYYTDVQLSSETPPVEPGIIRGTVFDQRSQALANVGLRLSRQGWSEDTLSGPDGVYTFTGLEPATYSLLAVDYGTQIDGLVLAAGQELVVDVVLQIPLAGWRMEIERRGGLPILVGVMPRAGIEVTIVDPYGNASRTFSGSKPEHGVGGWETWAPHVGDYHVLFLDQSFKVSMNGQATVLTFYEGEVPTAAQGVIQGLLRDHALVPQPGRDISLTGQTIGTRTSTTASDGSYRFENLPAGSYTLRVVGTNVTQTVQSDGVTPVAVDLQLPPPTTGDWIMEVTRGSGLPLLTGNMPEAGIQVTISDPYGRATQVVSGSKPEHGLGGWEVYAPYTGVYTIRFLDQTFTLPMSGQYTHVEFKRGIQVETKARLVTQPMPFPQADGWLQYFEASEQTRGLFTLEEL
ncbi:MAG: hypothetical protein Kow0063_32900 [Anaerolineae bacterium]